MTRTGSRKACRLRRHKAGDPPLPFFVPPAPRPIERQRSLKSFEGQETDRTPLTWQAKVRSCQPTNPSSRLTYQALV